ncbi:uncharacterized protein [Drosophila kikkawai]|uniref:Uncharacterized protein n=1 Tax=Drosophila kikkawai TaxID=30033 RepID=A0ABM4GNF5_DROKI
MPEGIPMTRFSLIYLAGGTREYRTAEASTGLFGKKMDYENLFNTEDQKEQSQELTTRHPPAEEKKHTEIMNLLGRLLTEVTALRSEVASIKAKVCGEPYKPKAIMPQTAISTLEDLKSFERTLNNSNIFLKFVSIKHIIKY